MRQIMRRALGRFLAPCERRQAEPTSVKDVLAGLSPEELVEAAAFALRQMPEWGWMEIHNSALYQHRFSDQLIAATMRKYSKRYRGMAMVMATDVYSSPDDQVPAISVADLAKLPAAPERAVILAFEDDENALAAMDIISSRPGWVYLPLRQIRPPAAYFHRNRLVRETLVDILSRGVHKFERTHFENLLQALELTRQQPGAFVEIGAYKGTSALVALEYMKRAGIDRASYILDTYTGFDYATAAGSADASWKGTHGETSLEAVTALLADYPRCTVARCEVTNDPLPAGTDMIAVAHIDVDIEEATYDALVKVAPRIVPGGLVVMDDSGHTPYLSGAYRAQARFLAGKDGARFMPIHLNSGQYLLVCLHS